MSIRILFLRTSLALFASTLIFQAAHAQSPSIKGSLVDSESGEFLNGVTVTLFETIHGTQSQGNGYFELENVPPGRYRFTLSKSGYNRYDQLINLRDSMDLGTIPLVRIGAGGSGQAIQKTIRSQNILRLLNERPNFSGGNMIFGIAPEPKTVEGHSFLDEKWNLATLLLYENEKLLEGYAIRYNISSHMFEVLAPNSNKATSLPGRKVQNFVWLDSTYKVPRYFVNGKDFMDEGSPISGFFEVIVEGELTLVRRMVAVLKESNYNEALMVGNRNDEIIRRNIYYYLNGKEVTEIPRKRKDLFRIFGEKEEEMKDFASNNSLEIKEPSGLFQLFTHYNSHFDGFDPIMNQLLEVMD